MSSASTPSPIRALAAAASALVQAYDITDILASMLPQAAAALGAEAAALLVQQEDGELDLLASTSHAASELEIYQAQTKEGPCVECIRTRHPVTVVGRDLVIRRWPTIGRAMAASGYVGVHAEPLRWRGRALGGLNLFFGTASPLSEESLALAQTFADIMTLALVQTQEPSDRELASHIRKALDARTVVEQAKGVLMQTHDLDPGAAYQALRARASEQGVSLSEMARSLVWREYAP